MSFAILLFSVLFRLLHPYPTCPQVDVEVAVPAHAGHTLAGTLSLPRDGGPHPVVILIGGAGRSERDYATDCCNHAYTRLAEQFVCAGMGALRFDEVGTGASTGSYRGYATTHTLAADVTDLVDALQARTDVASHRVFLLGHSEGGVITALVAVARPSVAGVILLGAPVLPGQPIIAYQTEERVRRGDVTRAEADVEHATRLATEPWYREFLVLQPAPLYAALTQPVFIGQGATDWRVRPEQADSILKVLRANGNRRVACRRYADLGHGFYRDAPPFAFHAGVLRDIVRWAAATSTSVDSAPNMTDCRSVAP